MFAARASGHYLSTTYSPSVTYVCHYVTYIEAKRTSFGSKFLNITKTRKTKRNILQKDQNHSSRLLYFTVAIKKVVPALLLPNLRYLTHGKRGFWTNTIYFHAFIIQYGNYKFKYNTKHMIMMQAIHSSSTQFSYHRFSEVCFRQN